MWILGRHRLMCGDSTDLNDIDKLLGGVQSDLVLTDPPYNVAYEGGTEDRLTIENDNMDDSSFIEFLVRSFENLSYSLKEGGAFYVWYASRNADAFIKALKINNLEPREQLIWVKNTLVLGRQDYQWRHEPCLYGWKEGAPHYFVNIRTLTTVNDTTLENIDKEKLIELYKNLVDTTTTIYEDRPTKNDIHPTMKPVALFKKLIRNSSRENENVLDLFGGSGTTLIACEEMNRNCFIMEFDPQYAEAIIERWENLTGEKAYLLK